MVYAYIPKLVGKADTVIFRVRWLTSIDKFQTNERQSKIESTRGMRAKVVFCPSCVLACACTQAYVLVHMNMHRRKYVKFCFSKHLYFLTRLGDSALVLQILCLKYSFKLLAANHFYMVVTFSESPSGTEMQSSHTRILTVAFFTGLCL